MPLNYVILTKDWKIPIYFCKHEGQGFTVSTDQKKAVVFPDKKDAQMACRAFENASGMSCEVHRLTVT
jgi:hypothetical protein